MHRSQKVFVLTGFTLIALMLIFQPWNSSTEVQASTVVLNATPTSRVDSDSSVTTRIILSESEQNEYRVLIVKDGEKYFWATRENRELVHRIGGATHYFIDPLGGGYIKVFDTSFLPDFLREQGPRFAYYEHLSLGLQTITYWGTADEFSP